MGKLWQPRRKCHLPKDDAVANSAEEVVGVRVHGDDVAAVGVVFQGFVYPVHEGVLLFLCKTAVETTHGQGENLTPSALRARVLGSQARERHSRLFPVA